MNIILVHNPKSGSALSENELRAKCNKHHIAIDAFVVVDKDLSKKIAPYIKDKRIIAAIGGDGTLSAVAGILAGTKAIFAPLPGGTLNHFTKDLGVPQDIDKALGRLLHLKPRSIDVALVNKKVFINNASVGLYTSSLHTRKRFEDRLGKWLSAIIASIRALIRFRTYTVTIDKETFRTPFIFVGNNEYKMTRPGVVERKNIDKGTLSIFIARTASRRVLLKIAVLAIIGNINKLDEFESRKTSSFVINTLKKQLSVSRDGEVDHVATPLRFEVQKSVLRVLAG